MIYWIRSPKRLKGVAEASRDLLAGGRSPSRDLALVEVGVLAHEIHPRDEGEDNSECRGSEVD